MNLNQQSLSDKVRLNEEPNTNTIFGVDGSTSLDLPFLTRALDALPLLETRELSSLKISGEAAYMLPDPNTRKSPIPADGGEGIAYIDDFEGARKTTPLGITFAAWTLGSPPADNVYFPGIPDTTKAFSRGRMTWFNRLPTDVKLTDIYPQKRPGSTANNLATVMDIQFAPQTRGQYNYSVDLENTLTRSRNWGFIQKPISISAINLTKENIEFLEIWMRVDQAPADPSTKLIVDLGVISEDVIPNRILNSEDLVLSSYPNGVLQEGEDTGLDMFPDAIERDRYAAMIAKYPDMAGDPSGDNYSFNNATVGTLAEDFTRINGSEANRDGPAGRIPDTEDINLNGIVDLANSYFQFEIPLDTTGGQGGQNPYIVGGGNMGWYQFRVPLKDFLRRVGSPSAENIEFVRLGFSNISDSVHLRIAEINLAGNQWQKLQKEYDTTFAVTVVNIEENPQYTSPPGVIRERDKTRPEEEVYANEQSLAIIVNDLPDGESRQVQKFYTYRALDVFNYKTMKMFVHGDEAFQYVDETNYDAEVFFRFGLDSLNFYEYRAPLRHGWDPMNDITINFADVTALKQARDSVNVISDPVPVQGGPPGAVYRVLGRPSLTQIVYLSIGVENPRGKGTTRPLRGQVWANELRVVSVDDTPGWAYRFDTQLRFADLGAVSFNFSRVDPYFHALEQRFGSRQMSTTWALNASTQLERLLPADWGGTSIPFSYSHTEGFIQPKYLPNSDVLVSEAAEQTRAKILSDGGTEEEANAEADRILSEAETRRTSDTYAAPNFRIVLPTSWWLIRDTFNKLTYGFTYTEANERSPAVVYRRNWSWNARMGYALTLPPDYFLQPFRIFEGIWLLDEYKDFKLFFPITGFNASVGSIRSRDVSMQRTAGAREIITRNFSATRQFGLGWKLTEGGLLNLMGDYNVQIASSLLGLETDSLGQQRPFSEILGDIFLSDGIVNFGEDTQLQQRTTFGTKPNIPNIFGLKKYFDLSLAYSSDYSWQNSLTRGDLGKSAGWNSSINFSTNLRLKQLFDPLFESSPAAPALPAGRGRRGEAPQPGTQTEHDTTETDTGPSGLGKVGQQLGTLVRVFIKIPFLDYDNINVTFTQSNSVQNTGVVGDNGMGNFWTLSSSTPERGPSRLYQLGLISDPSGSLTNFGFRSSFPFIGADVTRGPRAAGGVLLNSFRQQNRVGIKTSRGLWEGARLDMSWNLGWSYNRTENIVGDSLTGEVTVLNTTSSRSLDRSFMSFPDVFIFGVFNTGIEAVSKKYAELKSDKGDTRSDEEKLSQAFEDGFESIPWLKDVFGEFYPRLNWSLRWDGLEKLPLFSSFTQRLSLDHAYTSGYTRQYQNRPGSGGERTEGQRVNYGFTPLVGLNFQFKELWKGSFGSNFRYSSTTSYDLSTSSRNIVEAISQEMSITASYARRGFEIPFFGLALNNDIDISFSYAMTRTSRKTYDVSKIDINVTGTPLEGSTRTVMEPRIKYVLSQRVTASVYYRHTKIEPDDFGSRIPGSTTNEAGLDIHIAIQ
jgi:cell surface protein SprA